MGPIYGVEGTGSGLRNRLHSLCPYFAMFPEGFVESCVREFTHVDDYVFDPFSGRGTTVLQSLLMGRRGIGMDVNPVAYCVSGAKAEVPALEDVLREIDSLQSRYLNCEVHQLAEERRGLPPFFGRAFHHTTLEQLLFLRSSLNWRRNQVQRFVAAIILGILHGEMDRSIRYLSNQMPRTISPKPSYSLRYWRQRNLWPKKKDVFERLRSETGFRLSGEVPSMRGVVRLGNARKAGQSLGQLAGMISCVITSPPYFDVTDCAEDQWLRLWFLGNDPKPTYGSISPDDRYESKERYWQFLTEVWAGIGDLLRPGSIVVCRLGGRGMTEPEITSGLTQSVSRALPNAALVRAPVRTELRNRQTNAFRPGSQGCRFEIDYTFSV